MSELLARAVAPAGNASVRHSELARLNGPARSINFSRPIKQWEIFATLLVRVGVGYPCFCAVSEFSSWLTTLILTYLDVLCLILKQTLMSTYVMLTYLDILLLIKNTPVAANLQTKRISSLLLNFNRKSVTK